VPLAGASHIHANLCIFLTRLDCNLLGPDFLISRSPSFVYSSSLLLIYIFYLVVGDPSVALCIFGLHAFVTSLLIKSAPFEPETSHLMFLCCHVERLSESPQSTCTFAQAVRRSRQSSVVTLSNFPPFSFSLTPKTPFPLVRSNASSLLIEVACSPESFGIFTFHLSLLMFPPPHRRVLHLFFLLQI